MAPSTVTAQHGPALRATPLDRPVDLLGLAGDPRLRQPALVSAAGWRLLVAEPQQTLTTLGQLSRYADQIGWRDPAGDGPPFRGGAVGTLSDDLSAGFLHLGADERPPLPHVPALRFTTHSWAVATAPDGQGWIVGDRADTARLQDLVSSPTPAAAAPPLPGRRATAGLSPGQHADALAQILEWIAAGDLYQANLTFQIWVPWSSTAIDLARRLEAATPRASHAGLVWLGPDCAVISASPETFLRSSGNRVVTRPIKGTRPRGNDAERDAGNAAELAASAKDAAEHVMIVDLARNDLGRVCAPGTVRVPDLARLEEHPTVWHLTSTVEGELRDEVSLADLIVATFPPGSVTGAPKRMAVQRIRQVEPVRRGVYCGAVGLVAPGTVDLSVAIRTAVLHDGVASYGAGGGIVADSLPDEEYAEALAKAAAFLSAANATLQG